MAYLAQGIKATDKAVSCGDLGLSVILRASTIWHASNLLVCSQLYLHGGKGHDMEDMGPSDHWRPGLGHPDRGPGIRCGEEDSRLSRWNLIAGAAGYSGGSGTDPES